MTIKYTPARRGWFITIILGLALLALAPARAAELTWDNGTGNFFWDSVSTNWSSDTALWNSATPDTAVFGATGAGTVLLQSAITAGAVTVNPGATGYTITNNTLTLQAASAGATTLTASEDLSIGSAITLGANSQVFSVAPGKTLTLRGIVSGAIALKYAGGGTHVIGGVNTDSGNLTIDASTVHVNSGATLFCSGFNFGGFRSVTIQNGGVLESYNWANSAGNLWGQCSDGAGNITFATGGGTFRMLGTTMNSLNKGITVNSGITGRFEVATGLNCTLWGAYPGRDFIVNSGATLVFGGGGNFTTSRIISGAGSIQVTGGGTLALCTNNTFTGSTLIASGTLLLSNAAPIIGTINSSTSVNIAAGASLDVSGFATYNLPSGATLIASGTGTTVGTTAATIKGGTTVNLGSRPITLVYDGANPALYISQGALVLTNNVITVNGATLSVGTYTIIQAAGGTISTNGTLTVAGSAIPAGVAVTPSVSGGLLQITLTAGGEVWTGLYSSEWSTATLPAPKNWTWGPGGSAVDFTNGNAVYFPDSSANTAVNLSVADVVPGTVNFSATNAAYTLGGAYAIAASASLVKSGGGTLTINNANTYTNGTTLSGGQLNINNGGTSAANSAIGAGPLTITGGTIDNTSSGDVTLQPAIAQNWNGNFSYLGSAHNLNLGSGAVNLSGNRTVTVGGNALTVGGTITGAGNTLTKTGNGTLNLGGGSIGGLNLSQGTVMRGSGTLAVTNALSFNQTNASLVVTGGTNTVGGAFTIGNTASNSLGALTVSGGALTISGSVKAGNGTGAVGTGQNASILQTGGVITVANAGANGEFALANWGGTTTVDLLGGTFAAATYWGPTLSQRGTSIVTISNTAEVSFAAAANGGVGLTLAGQAGSTCTLNLAGGRLTVARLANGSGAGTLYFNGGTLRASASSTDFLQGISAAYIQNGGAIIDTGSNSITIATMLMQDGGTSTGGLTKNGSGTLTLTAGETYVGPTVVNAGGLVVNGSLNAGSTVTIANNASLSGSGYITDAVALGTNASLSGTLTCGPLTLGAGDTVTSGSGQLTASSATFLGAATLNFTATSAYTVSTLFLSGGTQVLTNYGVAGSLLINITGAPMAVGTYNLIYAPGGIAGTGFSAFTLASNPGGGNYFLVDDTAASGWIQVQITNPHVWTGAQSTEWSTNVIAGLKNWTLAGFGAVDFSNGAAVVFDDTTFSNLVEIAGADVVPASVAFNNNAYAYEVKGNKGIAGTGPLSLVGTGTVTISTTNSFTGPVTVSGGATLVVPTVANAGVASPIGAGSAITLGGGKFTYAGATAATDRSVNLTVDSTIEVTNPAASLTLAGVVSGAGNLTKTGNGTLTLIANDSFGATTISAGTLQLGAGTAAGSVAGSVTDDAALVFNRTNTLAFSSIISGLGTVAQSGSGTVALNAANTYSGGTLVNAGALQIGNNSALGTGLVTINGGVLQFPGDAVSRTIANPVHVPASSTAVIRSTGAYATTYVSATLTGGITNDGSLLLEGGPTSSGHDQLQVTGGFVGVAPSFAGHVRLLTTPCTWNSGSTITLSDPNGQLELRSTSEVMPSDTTVTVTGGRFMLNGVSATMTQTIKALNGTGGNVSCDWGNNTLRIGANDGSGNYVGTITDGSGTAPHLQIEKIGAGTQVFGGTNTYSGWTHVSGGTLLVNGTLAASSAVTVSNGATLGGTGTIGGTVVNDGTLSPGTSVGTLIIGGALTLNAGSTNTFEVNGSTSAHDAIALGSTVSYGGTLNIVPTGTFAAGQTFTLFSGAGAANPGNFASIAGSPGGDLHFSFTNGVLSVLSAAVTPPPATLTNSVSGSTLSLSWPAGQGWKLQWQTNGLNTGLGTNWMPFTDGTTSSTNITVDPSKPAVFYRLVYP